MKVYQVNVVCGSGSTGKIVTDLAHTIKEYGGESRIAYGRGSSPEGIDAIKVSSKLDLYIHAVLTRITDKHGLYSKEATKRLVKDIKTYKPDIIHLHNIHGYYLNYEMLFRFLKEYNRPIVWTLHDCWTFTGHCAHFDYVKCDKWKSGCYACAQKKRYPKSNLFDNSKSNFLKKKELFNLPNSITIVTVSEWLKGVAEKGILKKYPILKISNGIDLKIFKPTENDIKKKYHLENKKIVLGVASTWEEYKGIQTFFELAEQLPDNYQVVMIGLNDKQMKEKPEEILGIPRTANQKELVEWYSSAEVYVNTSVEETMGLTTVEAMACGTPVIVMNTTASPELVDDNCGIIVEPNDLEGLKQAVIALNKTTVISDYCINHVKEYEKDKQYTKYIDLYKKILYELEN